ncbi:MAG TPA: histidine kinase dimerization/phosphoacceptor domain -containing protein [Spirochaetota bacterium]|nr:histidine kinase dimerization/phosphoacceptor domain -containing protein [Spirochaetota bacterium]
MAFPFIKIFTVPVFLENSIEARRANILVSLLRFVVLVLCISVVATIVLFAKKWESFIVIGCMAVPAVLSFILLRMRRVYPASLVLLSGIWVVLTALIYFAGGMQSIDAIYYAALAVMAGLLLGVRATIGFGVLCALSGMVMVLSTSLGLVPLRVFPIPPWAGWLNMCLALFLIISLLNIALRGLEGALSSVETELDERRRVEHALRESEARALAILQAIPDMMFLLDRNGIIVDYEINLSDIDEPENLSFQGKNISDVFPFHIAHNVFNQITETLRTQQMQVDEYQVPLFGHQVKYYEARMVTMGSSGIMVIVRDITERKHAEKRIKESLHEKEVLLKEIHHRVKNNMQVISSLISLQMRHITNQGFQELFIEIQNRVRTMALVHEKLYQSENIAQINLKEYFHSLKDIIWSSYSTIQDRVRVVTDVEDHFLDLDRAIPVGLIVNELLTNAIKYAFPDGRDGQIDFSCHRESDGKFIVRICDNGAGIRDDINLENSETLGFQIVNALVHQIGGSISVVSNEGTCVEIVF